MADGRTWLERVRAGEPFTNPEPEFFDLIFRSKDIEAQYNAALGFHRWAELLKGWWGKVGEDVVVLPTIRVDVGINIEIGDRSFLNVDCTLLDTYPIRIGRDVMIGPNCALYAAGHPLKASERAFQDSATGEWRHATSGTPIVLEDNVWLGGNVIVLPGVTIGARSVIGAGSVVTKSIPPDVVAAGNPCRVIRQIA